MIKTIIFDFDGVIVDSFSVIYDSACMFYENLSEDEYKEWFTGNVHKKREGWKRKNTNVGYLDGYEKNLSKIKLYPEASETLKKAQKDYLLFINSSTPEYLIERSLEKNGLENLFKEILGYNKSSSKIKKFEYLFEKYKLKPEECIFITDTLGDILEANEVRIKTIAVDFGFHERKVLEKGKPFKIISNFKNILDFT